MAQMLWNKEGILRAVGILLWEDTVQQHYQDKTEARIVQRYKQYLSDADKSDSAVTTTTLQQLEQLEQLEQRI